MHIRVAYAVVWVLLFAQSLSTLAAETEKRPIVIDDYFTVAGVGDATISPDGKQIAYAEYRWQESTGDRKAELWLTPTDGGSPTRITFDRGNYSVLRWSPDSKHLYFVSARRRSGEKLPLDGTSQVWRMKPGESEPVPVTAAPGGIRNFDLSADGKSLFYTTSQSKESGPWAKLREQFPKQKYGTVKSPRTTIHRVDTSNWRDEVVAEFAGAIVELAANVDGSKLAMVTGPDSTVVTLEGQSQITVLDVASGGFRNLPDAKWRKELPSPFGRLNTLAWSPDGASLAFACGFDAFPSELFVSTWSEEGSAEPTIRRIARPGDVSLTGGVDGGTQLAWRGKSGELCFLGSDRGRVRIYLVADAGTNPKPAKAMSADDVCVENFNWDAAGQLAAITLSTPKQMSELYLYDLETGEQEQLTDLNPQTREWRLPQVSILKWKGRDGRTVEGILELPAGYKKGDKLPLIVSIHGGPTAMSRFCMSYGINGTAILASQGYALLLPNYRGSTGYGDEFIAELIGHSNDIDVDDILRGVDALVEEGIADPDRLGVCGWSNGGFLTNCIIAKTNRFKAAASGAGIADWTLEWGSNDEPAFSVVFFGGTPWEKPENYRRASPIYNFGNVKTPTLIHVGEGDVRCPIGNSQMIHRALKDHCGVDTELVIYPGEGHGLGSYENRKAKLGWDLAWFNRYLKGEQ